MSERTHEMQDKKMYTTGWEAGYIAAFYELNDPNEVKLDGPALDKKALAAYKRGDGF